jgi:VanZ family protein
MAIRRNYQKALFFAPAVVYYAAIFILSSQSRLKINVSLINFDKFLHMMEFAGLGFLLSLAFFKSFAFSFPLKAFMIFLSGVALGILDEFHQSFVPGRTSDVWDAAADALGVALSIVVYSFLAKKTKWKIFSSPIRILVLAAFILMAAAILVSDSRLRGSWRMEVDLPPLPESPKETHPKMEDSLSQISGICLIQGIEKAREFAFERRIPLQDGVLRVVVEYRSEESGFARTTSPGTDLLSRIELMGGKIESTAGNLIQAKVSPESLLQLANLRSVKYLRQPVMAFCQVTSEGVAVTGADLWQPMLPYRPQGAKVCVLDKGFKGYEHLLGTELPSTVTVRSFRADGALYDGSLPERFSAHGTACAEIIHDMAPDAELTLVSFETDVEFHNAMSWIIDNGIQIISSAVAFPPTIGAGDGTGPICEDVKRAHGKGILFVSAAGNAARQFWSGAFQDFDNDRWHNFTESDETNAFFATAGTPLSVYLSWDDWGAWDGTNYKGSDQDYDLYLYRESPFTILAKSENLQSGTQLPYESISLILPYTGTYHLAIRQRNGNKGVKFRLYVKDQEGLQYSNPENSLLTPADSPQAMAVGATLWSNDVYEAYSSQGPTTDGRIKPDFTAPTGISTATYGQSGFFGTSASAAHVAGAIALVKIKSPLNSDQIEILLEKRAKDLGPPGKDNQYGAGRLSLMPVKR